MVTRQQAASIIAHKLNSSLDEGKVIFMLSGGSAVGVGVAVLEAIEPQNRKNLFITLSDERYGPRGHKDSNWLALENAGLNCSEIDNYIILWDKQISREATGMEFESILRRKLQSHHKVIALLGVGLDGHMAGILPGSPAAEEQSHLVADYEADDYQRITIAPAFFKYIDTAYLYAEGTKKKAIIDEFANAEQETSLPVSLLRSSDQYVVLYNQEAAD